MTIEYHSILFDSIILILHYIVLYCTLPVALPEANGRSIPDFARTRKSARCCAPATNGAAKAGPDRQTARQADIKNAALVCAVKCGRFCSDT